MAKNSGFEITVPRWQWLNGNVFTNDPNPRLKIKGKPIEIHATCNACGTKFKALEARALEPGKFTFPMMGIQCPKPTCLQIADLHLPAE